MRRSNRHAFTLIELLVVISIIALLISILLPALKQAREAGQNVVCLSQMRQTGLAVQMYANDFDNWTPINYQDTKGTFPIPKGGTPRSTHGLDWEHRLGGKLVDWSDHPSPLFASAPWRDNTSYITTTKNFYCPSFQSVRPSEWWSQRWGEWAGYMWEFWNPEQYTATDAIVKYDLGTSKVTMNPSNALITDVGWEVWRRARPDIYGPPAHANHLNVLYLGGHAGNVSLSQMNQQNDAYERLQFLQEQSGQ